MEILQSIEKNDISPRDYFYLGQKISTDWIKISYNLEIDIEKRRAMHFDNRRNTFNGCQQLMRLFQSDSTLTLEDLYQAMKAIHREKTLGAMLIRIAEKAKNNKIR